MAADYAGRPPTLQRRYDRQFSHHNKGDGSMADDTVRGRFVWHELLTPNKAAAHDFYSKAVGWAKQAWEQDPSYTMFAAASGPLGASIESREDAPHWRPYIGTLDVDETVATATRLGAKVLTPADIVAERRAVSPCSRTRTAGRSACTRRRRSRVPRRRPSTASSTGTSSRLRPIRSRRSPSIRSCAAGTRSGSTTWARWASISCSAATAARSVACSTRVSRACPAARIGSATCACRAWTRLSRP